MSAGRKTDQVYAPRQGSGLGVVHQPVGPGDDIASGKLMTVTGTGASASVAHGLGRAARGALVAGFSAAPSTLSVNDTEVVFTLASNATLTIWVF